MGILDVDIHGPNIAKMLGIEKEKLYRSESYIEPKAPVLGTIENMSGFICPNCQKEINLFGEGGGEKTAYDLRVPFLGKIPIEPEIVRCGDSGRSFIAAKNANPAAAGMNNIVRKIKGI